MRTTLVRGNKRRYLSTFLEVLHLICSALNVRVICLVISFKRAIISEPIEFFPSFILPVQIPQCFSRLESSSLSQLDGNEMMCLFFKNKVIGVLEQKL